MRLPRMQTLVHTALGVAVVGVGAAIYMQQKQLKVFSDSEFFKETLKILRTHRGAVGLLGEPIKQKGFRLGDGADFLTSEDPQFKINVKGPNDKGKIHLWAHPVDGKWSVSRIELEVNKHPEKRLLIKDGPKMQQQKPDGPQLQLQK